MSKAEFYKKFIQMQKESGQGLSGIVKIMGPDASLMTQYLDEFIEEGLAKACDTGNSIGHPETNIFYMPTKGYNVWEDNDPTEHVYEQRRNKGQYLTHVRFYLGILKEENSNQDDLRKAINPTMKECLHDATFMEDYSKWLKRNEKALKEMLSLDDYYVEAVISFSKEEKKWITEKKWYKDNLTVAESLKQSKEGVAEDDDRIKINKELISLYKRSSSLGHDEYEIERLEAEADITKTEKNKITRRKLNSWLEQQDQKANIQSIL